MSEKIKIDEWRLFLRGENGERKEMSLPDIMRKVMEKAWKCTADVDLLLVEIDEEKKEVELAMTMDTGDWRWTGDYHSPNTVVYSVSERIGDVDDDLEYDEEKDMYRNAGSDDWFTEDERMDCWISEWVHEEHTDVEERLVEVIENILEWKRERG